ncbi:MAG: phosphoribosylformylglycinamidine synthase subunit PurQ [Candidatus Bathyarchaeota archaeon]|nr:phosphoribosylformylglycinamidine synthase subunit PurQ [Candidatus Bathyarchaeota archaeon]
MKRADIKICLLRVGGTNCDAETKRSFEALGAKADIVHVNELVKQRNLIEYSALVFPGGFSYGDYVRAGAIWAKWILAKLGKDLEAFVDDGRPILGICNGFQVLVEAGLLPAFEGVSQQPEAALANNVRGYSCRWVYLKHENMDKCVFTWKVPKGMVLRMPIAHGEGRFIFPKEKEKEFLKKLYDNDQLVFRYCNGDGEYAEGGFPENPNGSFHDIAGICNPEGTVFGLMPHPERAFYWWQQPDWTSKKRMQEYGDGKLVFESLIDYLERKG